MRTKQRVAITVLVAGILAAVATGLDNGLGLTPQMGWSSWNHFGCGVNETLIVETMDALVAHGFRDAGYVYVNVDDCWQGARDAATHEIVVDARAFPHGMKYLADAAHARGLRLGLYSDAGVYTCQKRPGSLHYEDVDAAAYARWGVDYLKYDNCYRHTRKYRERYEAMRDALNRTGRPIFYSICEWGIDHVEEWGPATGNSWRTTMDIADRWLSMRTIIEENDKWAKYARPGAWNDPDMLEVGNGGMTSDQYRAHMSLWAIAKAPLIIGCDVRAASPDTRSILLNREVIAVNQDPLGQQGRRVLIDGATSVWAGALADGARALVLFNADSKPHPFNVSWSLLNVSTTTKLAVRDLWEHRDLGIHKNYFAVEQVKPTSALFYRLTPV